MANLDVQRKKKNPLPWVLLGLLLLGLIAFLVWRQYNVADADPVTTDSINSNNNQPVLDTAARL